MKATLQFTIIAFLVPYVSSAEFFVGYEAQTRVTDHAAIDIDQQKIDLMLALGRLENVKKIYEQGGNSQSIARVNIIDSNIDVNTVAIPSGTEVVGKSVLGNQVYGTLLLGLGPNDDEALIQYPPKTMESNRNCQVGGLVSMDLEMTDGCFADSGELRVLDSDIHFEYSYNSQFDNFNGRTIQRFSLFAEEEMAACGKNCPYNDFAKFVNYYGEYDYADKWIQAAFFEKSTSFDRGNIDFSEVGKKALEPAVQIATKFMNIWMYTIRMMESALDTCEVPCNDDGCKYDAVHNWDQAVAFHAGSLQDEGILLYAFADVMCRTFRSCGIDGSMRVGTSFANNKAIHHFKLGQSYILQKDCKNARISKEEIVKAMTIPLIQATLFTAYAEGRDSGKLSSGDQATKKVRAASFAASVLPIVHHCSEGDASIIYENLGIENGDDVHKEIDFPAVKEAFERNYQCMGVTCKGVGGIWEDGAYAKHAAPCQYEPVDETARSGILFGHFLAILLMPLAILGSVVAMRASRKRRTLKAAEENRQTVTGILDDIGLEDVQLDGEQQDTPSLPSIA
ncbi:unnamed protein product [Cylindrotheca closterium]|uniref:Uncharacterized protein n=1 Tax=Cylindrotheca closterium TaxID=2856 RepID=A0AAD2FHE7_9STRA|nr:unnamed protein product [Cylindrotheca closterium]